MFAQCMCRHVIDCVYVHVFDYAMLMEYCTHSLGGINIPVEMKPNITSNTKSAEEAGIEGVAAYYWCGNPGGG